MKRVKAISGVSRYLVESTGVLIAFFGSSVGLYVAKNIQTLSLLGMMNFSMTNELKLAQKELRRDFLGFFPNPLNTEKFSEMATRIL